MFGEIGEIREINSIKHWKQSTSHSRIVDNEVLVHGGLSTDLNQNIESKMLMCDEGLEQDSIELQKKLIQCEIALYKANDNIKKLESTVTDLNKRNNQLHTSLRRSRKECEKLKNENIEDLNVIKVYLSFR